MEKKKKRDKILYVKISKANKDYLVKESKKFGYSTLSEFIEDMITKIKEKIN